jgi:hypothetical protein
MPNLESLLEKIEYDDEENYNSISIGGPRSPLETRVTPIIRIATHYFDKATISSDSVNYVLLDDDPQLQTDRLLIAGDINFNPTRETKVYQLRKTCLMPKIKGLLSLTCILFAPFMELRFKIKF